MPRDAFASSLPRRGLDHEVLDAAAESATPDDAVAKMKWLLTPSSGCSCSLTESTAVAAARSGDLDRLRWLQERGCPMGGERVLRCALRHAGLAMVEWLVDEAGCRLPGSGARVNDWITPHVDVGESAVDGVAKVRWLQGQGAPPLDTHRALLRATARKSIRKGRVQLVRYLVSSVGLETLLGDRNAAERKRSLQTWECRCGGVLA